MNFTLTTALGDLDLLGEVAGGGIYEQLLPSTQVFDIFGVPCRFVTLEFFGVLAWSVLVCPRPPHDLAIRQRRSGVLGTPYRLFLWSA
ncbi:MAG: hypothetical protein A2W31_09945 [Planctomycetes bacterium RBG_16_64_10]|nr:MAG: hypothetical protein A2W31_09945 [Planctomycetes bacterium RBG_16_64_10]